MRKKGLEDSAAMNSQKGIKGPQMDIRFFENGTICLAKCHLHSPFFFYKRSSEDLNRTCNLLIATIHAPFYARLKIDFICLVCLCVSLKTVSMAYIFDCFIGLDRRQTSL